MAGRVAYEQYLETTQQVRMQKPIISGSAFALLIVIGILLL